MESLLSFRKGMTIFNHMKPCNDQLAYARFKGKICLCNISDISTACALALCTDDLEILFQA